MSSCVTVFQRGGVAVTLIREAFQLWRPRREIALELRDWLEKKPSSANIERDLSHFVVKLYDMLIYMEGRADDEPKHKGDRVFSLLPISTSFVPSHIEINSSCYTKSGQEFARTARGRLEMS